MNAQRRIALMLSMTLIALSLAACGGAKEAATDAPEAEAAGQAQIANPFVDCDSAYDASQLAGFDVTFPESVPGYSERAYQAIEGQMVQCFYSEGEQRVLIRKAVDDGTGDVSGDYNEYSNVDTLQINDLSVEERGDGSLVYVAVWTKDGYAFAIDADAGLEASVIEELVAATM